MGRVTPTYVTEKEGRGRDGIQQARFQHNALNQELAIALWDILDGTNAGRPPSSCPSVNLPNDDACGLSVTLCSVLIKKVFLTV
jgi:hypothetical protein